MAGRANRVNQHQQGVVVAVRRNAHHIQEVTGGLSFGPQALLGPREKGYFAAFERFIQRLRVHITQHQYFTGNRMLHDDWHQSVGFFPVQLAALLLR